MDGISMRKKISFFSLLLVATNSFALPKVGHERTSITWHADIRKTPKLVAEPSSPAIKSLSDLKAYLHKHRSYFKLKDHLKDLILTKTIESLRGTHYYFQQIANGVVIKEAELIVSIDRINSQIYNIYNNTMPDEVPKIKVFSTISAEQALDIAWKSLKVHGPLMGPSKTSLEYRLINDKLMLVYVTHVASEAPFGHFEHIIDASNGKILAKYDTAITRKKQSTWPRSIDDYQGPIWDRKALEKKLSLKAKEKTQRVRLSNTQGDGKALVFDPDPRTTLKDRALDNSSPAEAFENAYLLRDLKNLTFNGSEYSLEGPWVTIADFEPPNSAPSKSADGNWSAKRGDNAFNDVMTYFHLDQNQQYIQSLGFTGEHGIQFGSIQVDSDGLNGADNSHYIPFSNSIAFGHGCTPDNEDADVILHEYGHAIHHSINSNWNGGDTGAMGEGFGDYWAASYSISTPNGFDFFPHEIFSWDGHGVNNPCWPGRILNALDARYDASSSYSAHSPISGGFQSDELWSTPLFQSLLSLLALGIPRQEVDRIILEAHFGLGANLSMREMANIIIRTANALYPQGPHANVFRDKFSHHNIIEIPKALLAASSINITNGGANNSPDPGETINLFIPIMNQGNLFAPRVRAELSSNTDGVQILSASSDYQDIDIGQQQVNQSAFTLALSPAMSCNTPINLQLTLSSDPGVLKESVINLSLPLGTPWPDPNFFSVEANLPIPDAEPQGALSRLSIANTSLLVKASALSIDVDIKHSFKGDLQVTLISPNNKRVILHNRTGGADDNLVGNYPKTLKPVEDFSKLENEPLDGEWVLEVIDSARIDVGHLQSWTLRAEFERHCEAQ